MRIYFKQNILERFVTPKTVSVKKLSFSLAVLDPGADSAEHPHPAVREHVQDGAADLLLHPPLHLVLNLKKNLRMKVFTRI